MKIINYKGILFKVYGDQLSLDIINAMQFEAKLPNDYLQFLLHVNGAETDCNIFDIDTANYKNTIRIEKFLGITSINSFNVLADLKYRKYDNIIEKDKFPIAVDNAGNTVFIALKFNGIRGKIYYWDHDYAFYATKDYDPKRMLCIANSFDEFLGMLYKDDTLN